MTDFYDGYAGFKAYSTPVLKPKHTARFDRDFWRPTGCNPDMSVLEVGCGTGLFLAYLKEKGVGDFIGIDKDPELAARIPEQVAERFLAIDIWDYLSGDGAGSRFDRVVLYDVLEHFSHEDGGKLLMLLKARLKPQGRILLRLPNMASPWGAQHQYGDLTHKAAYTPGSLRQLALSAGLTCRACFPHVEGSPTRRILDKALHGLLSRVLMTPPEIFSANFFAVLESRD